MTEVVDTEDGEFVGVFKSWSVCIVWLLGLSGMTGIGYVDSMGVECSLTTSLGFIP